LFPRMELAQVFGSASYAGPAKTLEEMDEGIRAAVARRLFESDEIWIGVTVLLEAVWVLESVYEFSTGDTVKALRGLLGLRNVRVEDAGAVAAALDAAGKGLELVDALHLLLAPLDAELVTFDRSLAKLGNKVRAVRLV
jgi:predicted nucleic-acid-binding protein